MTPESPLERTVFRWCVVALVAAVVLGLVQVYSSSGTSGLLQLGNAALLSFLFLGKFVMFAGLQEGGLSVWILAWMIFLMDMCCAFALASGLAGLERAPVLGGWLHRARSRALAVLDEYPGLRRMAFFGVIAFVLIPLAGTGAVTGSFVARILGLSRLSGVLAIALASGWSTLVFALLAHFLGQQAELLLKSPVLAGIMLILLVFVCWKVYSSFLKRLKA